MVTTQIRNFTRYRSPDNVLPKEIYGRTLLTTPQNGKIVLDRVLLSLWQEAQDHTHAEITDSFQAPDANPLTVAAGLACLAEAGLLTREEIPPKTLQSAPIGVRAATVSAVIVSYNGVRWLPACLESVLMQSYSCTEVIVVDNASTDGTPDWLRKHYPQVRLVETGRLTTFALALNCGMTSARGDYLLPLNQDLVLDPAAVAHLIQAVQDPTTAGAASCLRFLWAPAFLNGLGNQVRAFGWGSDNFIGELDLGQFNELREVPSLCMAAALIRRIAWEEIGPLDEGFPMYYEDSEWSYRARLLGYRLAAAPRALVYHAFGGQTYATLSGTQSDKLAHVVYGRLRFTSKLLGGQRRVLRLASCAIQDLIGLAGALIRFKPAFAAAYLRGWLRWLHQPPAVFRADSTRKDAVFAPWREIPHPHIWRGLPELTWDTVCYEYLPVILAGKTRTLPEFCGQPSVEYRLPARGEFNRLGLIWRSAGTTAALRYLWRKLRWGLG